MRKLLNTLYILDETAYLTLDGENIVCKSEQREPFRMPFTNIEEIYCFSYPGCSPALMGKCAEYGINLCFFEPEGRFLARIQGKRKGNIFLRKAQFELFREPPAILMQNTVAAKLANTVQLIRRSMRDNPQIAAEEQVQSCVQQLTDSIPQAYEITDRDVLMGLEGNCAKAYFGIFDRLILQQKDDFRMNARTKRPPLDPVNAALSFLYTVMTAQYAGALESVGLDSAYGFFHALRPGRASLACDLVEEIRYLAERLVLTQINLKKLTAKDFERQENGAVLLTKDGRKTVLTAWQEKKRSTIQHPVLNEKIPLGLLPYVQSNLLAKYIRGETGEYPCWLAR